MYSITARRYRASPGISKDKRLLIIERFFEIIAVLVVAKLFVIQVVQGNFYQALASGQHELYKNLFPTRGEILVKEISSLGEASYYPLATNKDFKTVYAEPRSVTDPANAAYQLSTALGLDKDELFNKLNKPADPYEPLKRKITDQEYAAVKVLNISGIKFQSETYRYYPEKNIGANVLGFVGISNEQRVGQYGLEGYFEEELRGVVGLNSAGSGNWVKNIFQGGFEAKDGMNIVTTIDRTVQYQVCRELNNGLEEFQADSGAAIVMDPFSGKIIAMCSAPDFDPNEYNKVDSVQVYNNTSVFTAYEPGSVFKPVTMSAALDMKAVTPQTTYLDTGEVKIDQFTIRNSDKKAHGRVDMVEVLNQSLNLGMIFVVGELGTPSFKRYVENFGFGQPTGITVNSEVRGDISSLSKKGDVFAYTGSFGQGLTVTPLQMVQAFAVLANGGYLVKPYIVDEYINGSQTTKVEPAVLRKVISANTSTTISGMLASVIKFGYGKKAGVEGYNVAGKTGTAQIADFENGGYSDKTNHTFVGYAPVENPKFVMLIKYENPKSGGFAETTSAVSFGRLAKFLLNYYKVPPTE